ncbi:MAG: cytidine deaminase [Staphylothermus sp.]|nr:cytidine deaminase [Staphylothermus sp.]
MTPSEYYFYSATHKYYNHSKTLTPTRNNELQQDKIQELIRKAEEILPNSYAPYSGIHVASAILTDKGNIYQGVNIENASLGLTMCAERTAIFNMVTHGDRKPIIVAIVTDYEEPIPPCGACRQVIAEFNPEATIAMYSTKSKKLVITNLKQLLPTPFKIKQE